MEITNWLTEEELQKIKDDRDPYEAPSSKYKIQPDNVGKLLWFSGKILIAFKSYKQGRVSLNLFYLML